MSPNFSGAARTPAEHRAVVDAWRRNASANDSEILPRPAAKTAKPRHSELSRRLRSLLTWRAATTETDWTAMADNDNKVDDGEDPIPLLLDSHHEIRPRLAEIFAALEGVELVHRCHAKLGGGGECNTIAVGDAVRYGEAETLRKLKGKPPRKPRCVIEMGGLRFSNGANEERVPMRTETGIHYEWAPIRVGGLIDCNGRQARERFGKAKGAAVPDVQPTVGTSQTSSAGAVMFDDPVIDRQEAALMRSRVGTATAEILDLALRASSFREIGQRLGFSGKNAERRGKAAVIAACEELESALAA